jgi:hypothetical protein
VAALPGPAGRDMEQEVAQKIMAPGVASISGVPEVCFRN